MYPIIKRCFDVTLALLALAVFFPVMLFAAWAVRRDSEGPTFYGGLRGGKGGKPFHMLKFRTMVANADKIGGPSTAGDDPRLTRSGKWLRKYKIDELPQLINVLQGEMSFVGPRPEVISEVEKYTPEERELLSVPPGITDWASIRFSNEGEILQGAADPHQAYLELIRPEKVRLGLEYVRQRSLLVDIRILFQTAVTIFKN